MECDCPKCQGYCTCRMEENETIESDDEIRKAVAEKYRDLNGEYATLICSRCYNFKSTPTGHYITAKITDGCPKCLCPDW